MSENGMHSSKYTQTLQPVNNILLSSQDDVSSPKLLTRILNFSFWIFCIFWCCKLFLTISGNKKCLAENSIYIEDLFRPPTLDCFELCSDLHEIDRLDLNIISKFNANNEHSRNHYTNHRNVAEYLEINYIFKNKPFVVEDAAQNWSARSKFNLEFFFDLYTTKGIDDAADIDEITGRLSCQFFRYKTNFTSLKEALTILYHENRTTGLIRNFYIGWRNCESEASEVLKKHYSKPYFLPKYSESTGADWIFMGTKGNGAHLHIDKVTFTSWQTQIKGKKIWTLFLPPECYYVCPVSNFRVVLNEGDSIVINTNVWYHKTDVIGDEISISIGSEFD